MTHPKVPKILFIYPTYKRVKLLKGIYLLPCSHQRLVKKYKYFMSWHERAKKKTCGSTVFSTGHPRQYSLAPAMLVCADRTGRGRFIAVWPQMWLQLKNSNIYPSAITKLLILEPPMGLLVPSFCFIHCTMSCCLFLSMCLTDCTSSC